MKLLNMIIPTQQEYDDVINNILRRPEYKHLDNGLMDFIEYLKQKISEWIFKFLNKRFSNPGNSRAISNDLSTIFIIAGLLVILGIVVVIIIKANKIMDKRKRVNEILGEKIDNRTTPVSLRNKASDCIREGDYRGAVRYDFIALLLLMHENNLVYLDETKTNKEIYGYLKKKGFKMLGVFEKLINIFNLSWYGHKSCDNEVYDRWSENIKLLWDEVISYEEKN